MDPSRGDSRYNLNYSMSGIGLSLADQVDMYGNPATVAALGGRPPSGGLIQSMGSGTGVSLNARPGGLMSTHTTCPSLSNASATNASGSAGQQRGIKRSGSDCYDDHQRGGNGSMTAQSLQGLDSCAAGGNGQHVSGQQQQQTSGSVSVSDVVDDSYTTLQNKKSPPANGKKTKGRVKIKMEYIDNKLRRYTTFSKRKTGIMKKAYELSTLTGTQVMLLVASETGHVYTFATRKLQPMITSEAGKQLIQTCLNSPDPPTVGGGDQRMSATGFEETELSYNIADEDSKDDRSPLSSANESEDSSDVDSPGPGQIVPIRISKSAMETATIGNTAADSIATVPKTSDERIQYEQQQISRELTSRQYNRTSAIYKTPQKNATVKTSENLICSASALSSIPQEMLLQLIQSGHLQLHTEEDGSGHQYVTIPLSTSTAELIKATKIDATVSKRAAEAHGKSQEANRLISTPKQQFAKAPSTSSSGMVIKEELE